MTISTKRNALLLLPLLTILALLLFAPAALAENESISIDSQAAWESFIGDTDANRIGVWSGNNCQITLNCNVFGQLTVPDVVTGLTITGTRGSTLTGGISVQGPCHLTLSSVHVDGAEHTAAPTTETSCGIAFAGTSASALTIKGDCSINGGYQAYAIAATNCPLTISLADSATLNVTMPGPVATAGLGTAIAASDLAIHIGSGGMSVTGADSNGSNNGAVGILSSSSFTLNIGSGSFAAYGGMGTANEAAGLGTAGETVNKISFTGAGGTATFGSSRALYGLQLGAYGFEITGNGTVYATAERNAIYGTSGFNGELTIGPGATLVISSDNNALGSFGSLSKITVNGALYATGSVYLSSTISTSITGSGTIDITGPDTVQGLRLMGDTTIDFTGTLNIRGKNGKAAIFIEKKTLTFGPGEPVNLLIQAANGVAVIDSKEAISNLTSIPITANTTATILWPIPPSYVTSGSSSHSHPVTFYDGMGGKSRMHITNGGLVPEPAKPIREGYTFIGWFKDEALTQPWDFENDRVRGTVTLYAGWALNVQAPEEVVLDPPKTGDIGAPTGAVLVACGLGMLALCWKREFRQRLWR